MIFEYTDDERKQLIETDSYYSKQLDDLDAEISNAKKGSKAYANAIAKHIEVIAEQMDALAALQEKFERARFDQLGDDPDAILEDGKLQAELIIDAAYRSQIENDIVLDDAGNWKPREENPQIESQDARAIIRRGLHLHLEALKDDAERSAELQDYMLIHISTLPYIYIDRNRKTPPQDAAIERQYAQITQMPQITKYGLMRNKVNTAYLSTVPTVMEIDGQLRMAWAVNQAGGKKKVPIVFALSQGGTNVKTTQRIEIDDDAIVSTVASSILKAMENGLQAPYIYTPQEIWRRMNGITDNTVSPSKTQLADTISRIDKMRLTLLYMDVRKEMEANYTLPDDERLIEGVVEDYYLPARKIYAKTDKGREALAYSFYDLPFIYVYNMAKGHIVLVDADLLDVGDTVRNNENTTAYKTYLLREIAKMYNGFRSSTKILYRTLYRDAGKPTPEERAKQTKHATENAYQSAVKAYRKNDREDIADILTSWKKRGWIKDFTPVKQGKKYIGVEIQLNPKNYEKPLPKKGK